MLNTDNLLMIAASFLLLAVNWLAFHDFQEKRTPCAIGLNVFFNCFGSRNRPVRPEYFGNEI